jgi:hydroxymethylpyrimidine pyrophosphatase-like HAD family hydrolase
MEVNDVKINGQEIAGVGLPEDILTEIKALYEQFKEEDYQKKLNSDIKYTMNDDTSYGIYNGISRLDIETIVSYIKKQYNSNVFLFGEEIAKRLNIDEEIKQIAEETYLSDPEGNWNEEYLTWFRKAVKEKKAPGYGIIPNSIIKTKITDIILKETEKENREKQDEENRINNLFELAKQIGERQLINKWSEPCNDPKEECNLDICYLWIMPDGSKKQTRSHTW